MQKAVVITGSTKGIGKAIGLRLLNEGFFVYFNYAHDSSAAEALRNELNKSGFADMYRIIQADMSNEKQIQRFVSEIDFDHHMLYSVILNASTNGQTRSAFDSITYDEMLEIFSMNVFVPFFLLQALAPHICEKGRVVFISSSMGVYPHSTYIPYGLTKSTEIFLAKMLVKEFAPRQITVNAVAPHCIETDMFPGKRPQELLDSIKSKIAVHRFGQTDEIASLVISIISNDYLNGAVIPVDGGYCYQ